jgi:hypothetical protein
MMDDDDVTRLERLSLIRQTLLQNVQGAEKIVADIEREMAEILEAAQKAKK